MMTFHWSWIFILCPLLAQSGSASPGTNHFDAGDVYRRFESNKAPFSKWLEVKSVSSSSRTSVAAIIAGVSGALAVVTAFTVWFFVFRNRKGVPHVEEGTKEILEGGFDLKSEFSPDEKSGLRFERIRNAFVRRGSKPQQSILPIYQTPLFFRPAGSTDRPVMPAQAHIPRYPSILERSRERSRSPPSHLGVDINRNPSTSEPGEHGDRSNRRRVQIPPKVLLVPPGRPLPGFGRLGTSRSPRSPSRRKSWLSKRLSRHPFIPLRDPDPSIHFAPGSPLHPDHYHPSRDLLEARLDLKSPRTPITPRTPRTPKTSRGGPVRRLPVPLYEEEIGATTKSARLAEALHEDGNRTPLPSEPYI